MRKTFWAASLVCGFIALLGAPAFAADIGAGQAYFQQRCQLCHVIAPDQKGIMAPNLSGLAGRKAGSTSYPYSAALKNAKVVWNKETLNQFLAAPNKMIPGTMMVVSIPDDQTRASVVAYLLSLPK